MPVAKSFEERMSEKMVARMQQIRKDLIGEDGRSWKKLPSHQFGAAMVPGEPHIVYITVRNELSTEPEVIPFNTNKFLEVVAYALNALAQSMTTPPPMEARPHGKSGA